MHVMPLHDRILVQCLEEGEQQVGGIIIPQARRRGATWRQHYQASDLRSRCAGSRPTPVARAGAIDPAKVVRSALQNAASIASLLLTADAVISQFPEEQKHAAVPGGMGGGMYRDGSSRYRQRVYRLKRWLSAASGRRL
jgi:hypothetical protein